jgi:hypothetical protein
VNDTLRENQALPCVFYRAHDKELLCHAFYIGRTTKRKRTGKNCLSCVFWDARQTLEFAVRFLIAHDKLFFANVRRPRVDTEGEPLAPRGGRAIFFLFAVRLKKRTTKRCLCRAFLFWRTTKYFPQFMSPKSQIQLPLKNSCQLKFFYYIYATLHCKIWIIFVLICYI